MTAQGASFLQHFQLSCPLYFPKFPRIACMTNLLAHPTVTPPFCFFSAQEEWVETLFLKLLNFIYFLNRLLHVKHIYCLLQDGGFLFGFGRRRGKVFAKGSKKKARRKRWRFWRRFLIRSKYGWLRWKLWWKYGESRPFLFRRLPSNKVFLKHVQTYAYRGDGGLRLCRSRLVCITKKYKWYLCHSMVYLLEALQNYNKLLSKSFVIIRNHWCSSYYWKGDLGIANIMVYCTDWVFRRFQLNLKHFLRMKKISMEYGACYNKWVNEKT